MAEPALDGGSRRRPRSRPPGLVLLGFLLLFLVSGGALLAPAIAPYPLDEIRADERLRGPSRTHPFGTDRQGRDVYSRTLYGGRASLTASALALGLTATLGVALGLLAGSQGGWVDGAVMRLADVLLAFPSIILAIVVAALFGSGLPNVVLTIVAVSWVSYARVTRGLVLRVRAEEHVLAARAIGAGPLRIALREVLPNILGPLLVLATLDLGALLVVISSLSFLGLGAQPPTVEWGLMLADGKTYFLEAPHVMVFPGVMIFVTVLGLNLIGEGRRDVFDAHA